MAGTSPVAGGTGQTTGIGPPANTPPATSDDRKWLLGIAALWFILVALAELKDTAPLATALAWAITFGYVAYAIKVGDIKWT